MAWNIKKIRLSERDVEIINESGVDFEKFVNDAIREYTYRILESSIEDEQQEQEVVINEAI